MDKFPSAFTEGPDSLPEPTESLPPLASPNSSYNPSFCLCNCLSCGQLSQPKLVSFFKRPTDQTWPVGLLLQPDSYTNFWRPPSSSGITATTGTNDLAASTHNSHFDNGAAEHGSFGLNVPHLPRVAVEALSEVGNKDQLDGFFHRYGGGLDLLHTEHLNLHSTVKVRTQEEQWSVIVYFVPFTFSGFGVVIYSVQRSNCM